MGAQHVAGPKLEERRHRSIHPNRTAVGLNEADETVKIIISSEGTNGHVIADAVQLVRTKQD